MLSLPGLLDLLEGKNTKNPLEMSRLWETDHQTILAWFLYRAGSTTRMDSLPRRPEFGLYGQLG